MNLLIEEGDEVYIQLDPADQCAVRGIVRHRPCATGDSWIIEGGGGVIHYVQMFCCMTLQKRAGGTP